MRVVRRVGGADDTLRRGEVDGQLASDYAVLDVGDAIVGQQIGQDAPVLAGLGRGQALQVADRDAQIEPDAEDVARA